MRALVSAVFVVSIIALLLVSGCTDLFSKQKGGGFGDVSKTTGSGGNTGGVKGGGSGPGSYPQNTYFSFDCMGEYKEAGLWGGSPWNHHGKFTLTGNVPFPIPYDYNNPVGYALYTDENAGRSDKSNPLHIQSELSGCWGTENDCRPCHFIFDGNIYAKGMMVFNQSAGPGRRWVVSFLNVGGGNGEIYHTNSIRQTESGCPVTDYQKSEPIEMIGPALSCYTGYEGADYGTPFDFSDGSGFVISPYVKPQNIEFTRFDPKVTFHIGRAPS